MDLVYRALGLTARWSERMRRTRVNFIPFNGWIILTLLLALFGVGTMIREGLTDDPADTPHLTVAEAINREGLLDRRVAVKGKLVPEHALSFEKDNGEGKMPDRAWIPLIDPDRNRAIYVEIDMEEVPIDDIREEWVTGMLRPLNRDLKSDLVRTGREIDGAIPNSDRMLVAGERPARLWIWIPLGALLLLATLAMLLVIPLHYTIFRPTRPTWTGVDLRAASATAATPPTDPEPPVEIRVTGRFSLTPTIFQRFVNMPSAIAEMESGQTALVSNIDASINHIGATEKRAGTWVIVLKTGTLVAPPDYGYLYFGLERLPAMRIRFTDDSTGKPARVILSFPTTIARDRVREILYDQLRRKRISIPVTAPEPPASETNEIEQGGQNAV